MKKYLCQFQMDRPGNPAAKNKENNNLSSGHGLMVLNFSLSGSGTEFGNLNYLFLMLFKL